MDNGLWKRSKPIKGVEMEFFIGIVPPEDYKEQISVFRNKWAKTFRNRWDNNGFRDPVEPHITIKAKSGLTEDMNWLEK